MADFTVRVDLHGAEWEDYDALRVEMEEEGFAAAVQGSGGMAYGNAEGVLQWKRSHSIVAG